MLNLRDRQIAAVGKILTLSSGNSESNEDFTDTWKVLVYDQDCRDIISPLMNIGALRQKGVTLHMLLHTDRESVQDAPAVYFVRPTEENIKRIAEDCSKQLYRTVFLHFVTRIERPLLEKLALELQLSNSVPLVSKVYDQYLDLIALEPSLFTLNIKDSLTAYSDPTLSESQIRTFMARVSTGIVSMTRVLGALPIIRAPTGGAAEMLAQELCSSLRENLSPRGAAQGLFADCLISDRPRPLLLIFDRSADIFPMLMHTSTYQALVDDLLDHRLNRVTVDLPNKEGPSRKKTYDLNTQADQFFGRFAGAPFPEAVEANEKELAEVSQREMEIRSKPTLGVPSDVDSSSTSGRDLSDAIESLPEILSKKANLEAHTNILQSVMKHIASREVPTYFELEQGMLTAGRVSDKPAVLALLRDGSKGRVSDKARLLAIVAITEGAGGNTSKALAEEYDQAFVTGCGTMVDPTPKETVAKVVNAVAFVRRMQSLQSPTTMSKIGGGKTAGGSQTGLLLSSFLTSAQSRATNLMAKAASFFTKFAPVYVSRVVDLLSEGKSCPEGDSFCSLDPRAKAGEPMDFRGQKYQDVIVFVVGGGCYSEFYNLQDLLKQKQASGGGVLRNIVYGCSDLLSGDDFIAQLERLASPSPK